MDTHSWVHLACHASQNHLHPTLSALYLHGGETMSLEAIDRKSLGYARFDFLSACQPALGDEKLLPAEAVHLAADLLMVAQST
jgi:CHAT domain-containing protein